MVHIALQEHLDGTHVTWLEHVTDEQYDGKARGLARGCSGWMKPPCGHQTAKRVDRDLCSAPALLFGAEVAPELTPRIW